MQDILRALPFYLPRTKQFSKSSGLFVAFGAKSKGMLLPLKLDYKARCSFLHISLTISSLLSVSLPNQCLQQRGPTVSPSHLTVHHRYFCTTRRSFYTCRKCQKLLARGRSQSLGCRPSLKWFYPHLFEFLIYLNQQKQNELAHYLHGNLSFLSCSRLAKLLPLSGRDFVEEKLGSKYVAGRPLDFAASFEESGPATPMFFILSPGVDPLKDVEKQGKWITAAGVSRNCFVSSA